MTTTVGLFVFAGGLACLVMGLVVGRLITLKGFTWTLKDAIGVALIGSFVSVLFILFWKEIPKPNEQLIVYMLGQLSGFVGGVISSHYGNKAGDNQLEAKREETKRLLAEAAVANATNGSLGGDGAPTGKPGDPVHTVEEEPQ